MKTTVEELQEQLNHAYQLRKKAESEQQQTEVILRGITALLEANTSDDLFASMYDIFRQIVPYEACFILQQNKPRYLICSSSTDTNMVGTQWLVDDILKRVINGSTLAVFNIHLQPTWEKIPEEFKKPYTSALYSPFKGPQNEGVLVFAHKQKGFYVQTHIDILENYKNFTSQAQLGVQTKLLAIESYALRKEKEKMEATLINADKMASVGLLAAGVAHEINNPMGFINANLNYTLKQLKQIRDYLANLQTFLDDLSIEPNFKPTEKISTLISDFSQQTPLKTVEAILEASQDSLDGVERVRVIVDELRNFSRHYEENDEDVDINECLKSGLKLVNNELKYHTKVELNLGEVMPIKGNGGKLTQVITNLLLNAGQAIDEGGIIIIRSGLSHHKDHDECVWFTISDSGCGISPDQIKSIFTPFYTTKPVGEGTGLGLTISYDIIDKMGGTIEVDSQLNIGTTFTIALPIKTSVPIKTSQ
ncbi:ATP-binding protein [Marinibactrum halimedae]|nr:ATP-binding protein [Marinibactrum halimedae]MCD9458017.1 ATP-binding protein [Marinibactrum halimedae]